MPQATNAKTMAKAKGAFRTISEVAEWLDTPTHVLRFWESKFSQIKPVKGAGGRRYYRPADMELLAGIKQLLHVDGLTIKGTQKLLREQGIKHVAALGQSLDQTPAPTEAPRSAAAPAAPAPASAPAPAEVPTPAPEAAKPAVAAPKTAEAPVQDALPFDMPAAQPAAPAPTPAATHGLLADLAANPNRAQANKDRIAPLVARLEALRARMAG